MKRDVTLAYVSKRKENNTIYNTSILVGIEKNKGRNERKQRREDEA